MDDNPTTLALPKQPKKSLLGLAVASTWVFFAVFAAAVLITVLVALLQPQVFAARCNIKIERPAVVTFEMDPTLFFQDQCEIIRSPRVLSEVIERLHLANRWGASKRPLSHEKALGRLQEQLSARCLRDTNVIEISVYDKDRYLAAEIANTVGERFAFEKLVDMRKETARGLARLRKEVDNQRQRVETAKQKALLPDHNVQPEVEAEQRLYEALETRFQQASIEISPPPSPAQIIDEAEPSLVPVAPDIAGSVIRGALIGLPLGIVLSLLAGLGLYLWSWRGSALH